MKLTELLLGQKITLQLLWGEQKIEFFSQVLGCEEASLYVEPYFHNGSELELNVTQDKGVVCNLFTNDPETNKRISWKNIELTTVNRDGVIVYCLRTKGFNNTAMQDDRRLMERIIVQIKGKAFEGKAQEGTDVIVHDISDVGISFYAPATFSPKSSQIIIKFTDSVDDKEFNVRVECVVSRSHAKAGNNFYGCKINGENKDYQLYGFLKRMNSKNKNKAKEVEDSE